MPKKCLCIFTVLLIVMSFTGCTDKVAPNSEEPKVLEGIIEDNPEVIVQNPRPRDADSGSVLGSPLQFQPQIDFQDYKELKKTDDIKISPEENAVSFWVKVNEDALQNGFNGILYNEKDENSNGLVSLFTADIRAEELALALLAVEGRTSGRNQLDSSNEVSQFVIGSEVIISLESLKDEEPIFIKDLASVIDAPWKPVYVMGDSNSYLESDSAMDFIGVDLGTPSLIVPSDFYDDVEFFESARVNRCCTVEAGLGLKAGTTYLLTLTLKP